MLSKLTSVGIVNAKGKFEFIFQEQKMFVDLVFLH